MTRVHNRVEISYVNRTILCCHTLCLVDWKITNWLSGRTLSERYQFWGAMERQQNCYLLHTNTFLPSGREERNELEMFHLSCQSLGGLGYFALKLGKSEDVNLLLYLRQLMACSFLFSSSRLRLTKNVLLPKANRKSTTLPHLEVGQTGC